MNYSSAPGGVALLHGTALGATPLVNAITEPDARIIEFINSAVEIFNDRAWPLFSSTCINPAHLVLRSC